LLATFMASAIWLIEIGREKADHKRLHREYHWQNI
jgi:hypothetical protein